ncbi:hypothetical protein GLOIN_2v1484522 [Rhizophagus clarus]|uniref:Uncharacterized protein n=1 Tax=Rhizophagus clarus TaxID=94130 RepID=A0A8H3KV25_9GLOM|nr:hypothetical protein GLOIN_2v1484522 [Rhizophagus clarus]
MQASTCALNCYPIPNDYIIQTKWGRGKENKVVQFFSKLSATNTADLLHKVGEIANDFYLPEDAPLLESMEFSIKDKKYDIYYRKENQVLKHKKEAAIVRAMDKSRILHNGYRHLTAIEPNLLREKAVSGQKVFINNLMKQNINIKIIDITTTIAVVDPDETPHIMDKNIVETVINSVEFQEMEGISSVFSCHYILILYPGSEEYNTLDITTRSLREELWQLKHQGLIDLILQPTISKNMNKLRNNHTLYPGHQKKSLFDMIDLENYLVDELYIMLRITDRLWSLVIHKVTALGFFDIAYEVIIKEIQRIGVCFQFWQERDSNKWVYTSLIGQDKIKVLCNFNLKTILEPTRA